MILKLLLLLLDVGEDGSLHGLGGIVGWGAAKKICNKANQN